MPMIASVKGRVEGLRRRRKRRRLDGHDEALGRQSAALDEARERLAATEKRLDEVAGRVAHLGPDDIARVQSLAEDGLARAGNAQAIAEDALARAVSAEGGGVDALARADNARTAAEESLARLVEAEARGVDASARAGNAQAIAEDALTRAAKVEASEQDALARADNARTAAEESLARLVEAEARGADALARAGNAQAIAEDALARAAKVEAGEEDALARADNVQRLAEAALEQLAAVRTHAETASAASGVALDTAREALLPARIAAFGVWLELSPPAVGALVSVILPTRDRPALLPRAVASLLAQRYDRWQLVVVDDGDTGAVEDALAHVEDDRVTTVEGPRSGLGAARNAGLDAATGDVVCYLDDDNVLHPQWLQAVAHVFAARDDVDVAYGVTLAEHRIRGTIEDQGWWPAFWQLPWSREALLRENVTDAGALAHRRTLPGARFQEEMGEDWDLLIRLTADRPALAVPAISHAYEIGGDDHMSHDVEHRVALDEVRRRHTGE